MKSNRSNKPRGHNMICGKCGAVVSQDDRFCFKCGAPVIDNFIYGNGDETVLIEDFGRDPVQGAEAPRPAEPPRPAEAPRPAEPPRPTELPREPEPIRDKNPVRAASPSPESGRADPTERHELVFLTKEEAIFGCTKIVEVDGRSYELTIPSGLDINKAIYIDGYGYEDKRTGKRGRLKVQFFVD